MKKMSCFDLFWGREMQKKKFLEKGKKVVDKSACSGYNNQAVFPREQRFAAVLELVDRPA